jgi:hypothetical protein
LRKIGPYNASLLTKIKFESHFKVGYQSSENDPQPLGFAQLFPIYLAILRNLCGNLQELTLHTGIDKSGGYSKEINYDTPDIKGPSNKTNEEIVDDAVGLLVKGLPWLRKLQLGNYKSLGDPEEDVDWGPSRRWVDVVNTRSTDDVLDHPCSSFRREFWRTLNREI